MSRRRRRAANVDSPFTQDEAFWLNLLAGAPPERIDREVPCHRERWRRFGGAVLDARAEVDREAQRRIEEQRAKGYTRWADPEPWLPSLIDAYGVPDGWTPTDHQQERTPD